MSTATRITIAEYDAMIAAGHFEPVEEHHVELIRGEIREMSPVYPPHENALDLLLEWSFDVAPRGQVWIRNQNSVGLPELESVPQPDLFWVRKADYSKQRPEAADVFLIIEVADSSLRFDRNVKAPLYAEAGVAEYWIADGKGRVIEVFRSPVDGEYRDVRTYAVHESLSPWSFPSITLKVGDVWP